MLLEQINDIQKHLKRTGIDGWLLYDFKGSNPTASQALGLEGFMITRRVMFYIPSEGIPSLICHTIDQSNLPKLPGRLIIYKGWRDLHSQMTVLLTGAHTVAMEYFPEGAIPYLSRVDAGTVGWIQSMGVTVVPSAELVQHFLCRFTPLQIEAHRTAASELANIKDTALNLVRERLRQRRFITEYELQEFIMEQMHRAQIVTDHTPIVSTGRHTADPHYIPSPERPTPIQPDNLLMIALWGRQDSAVSAYADLMWMAYTGRIVPEPIQEIFQLVVEARDAGFKLIKDQYNVETGAGPAGWMVDRAVREIIEGRGYGDAFPHRTGHNLGVMSGHGDGPHLDDFETHDTRLLTQGLCFTIEPGIYQREFGVRTGLNFYIGAQGPEISTPIQRELVLLFS